MNRQCARPGCCTAAAASFTYDYANRVCWLGHLAQEPHPMAYDLCQAHADALTVPRGWELEDRRYQFGEPQDPSDPAFQGVLAV